MHSVIPNLHASAPHPLPFGPALHVRAFLLTGKADARRRIDAILARVRRGEDH